MDASLRGAVLEIPPWYVRRSNLGITIPETVYGG